MIFKARADALCKKAPIDIGASKMILEPFYFNKEIRLNLHADLKQALIEQLALPGFYMRSKDKKTEIEGENIILVNTLIDYSQYKKMNLLNITSHRNAVRKLKITKQKK